MESKEGMQSDVTVTVLSDAPSTYVAPEIDNAIPYGVPVTQTPPPASTPVAAQATIPPSTFSTEKRKRGRPRKVDGASSSTRTISPGAGPLSVVNPRVDRFFPWSTGANFLPHKIIVSAGEDVGVRITSLLQHDGPRAICVISANGVISHATVRHTATSMAVKFEGQFQIMSLHGSLIPTEAGGSSGSGPNGELTVSLVGRCGRNVAGLLAGVLTAASPVEVVVGSFKAGRKKRRGKGKNKLVVSDTAGNPATNAAADGEQNMGSSETAPGNPSGASASAMEETTKSATDDTNLALGREADDAAAP